MADECKLETIQTKHCGKLNVYVQGTRSSTEVAVITVHDLGCNYNQYLDFLAHPHMEPITQRCVWFHVNLPGQGEGDAELPSDFVFPKMHEIAEDLLTVIDHFKIEHCVLLGEGAGANILARFALAHESRVLGAILLHCTGSTAGFMESMREKMIGFKLNSIGMNPSAEKYLVLHRFGSFSDAKNEQDVKHMVENFSESLKSINPKNLMRYINAFMGRTNITDVIGNIKCPVLFMTGSLATHQKQVTAVFNAAKKGNKDDPKMMTNLELIVVDNCANVFTERPEKLAETIQYFLQGRGLLSGVMSRRMSATVPAFRQRSMSMEEYDKPKGVENLLYKEGKAYPNSVVEDDSKET